MESVKNAPGSGLSAGSPRIVEKNQTNSKSDVRYTFQQIADLV